MEVIVDGKPLDGGLDGANLQEMLQDLMQRHLGDGRTIKELSINGEIYEEANQGAPEGIARERIESLVVETVSSREIADFFLQNAGATLATLQEAARSVAELFRMDDERQANEKYRQLLETLGLFLKMLQLSQQVLDLDFEAVSAGQLSANQRLERLQGLIGDMLKAQENQDWLLLADVLNYDLVGELKAWAELVPFLTAKGEGA